METGSLVSLPNPSIKVSENDKCKSGNGQGKSVNDQGTGDSDQGYATNDQDQTATCSSLHKAANCNMHQQFNHKEGNDYETSDGG